MTVVILGEAERGFAESVACYEATEASLGWRFRNEVVAAVAWISRNPELHRLQPKGYRRCNLRVFRITSLTSFARKRSRLSRSLTPIGVRSFGSIGHKRRQRLISLRGYLTIISWRLRVRAQSPDAYPTRRQLRHRSRGGVIGRPGASDLRPKKPAEDSCHGRDTYWKL